MSATNQDKLVAAVLRHRRHVDDAAALRASLESCEKHVEEHVAGVGPCDIVPPCWKAKVQQECGYEGEPLGDVRELRAALVAEHDCPACQRNEVKLRAWYEMRRKTGGMAAAVTRLARAAIRDMKRGGAKQ